MGSKTSLPSKGGLQRVQIDITSKDFEINNFFSFVIPKDLSTIKFL